MLTLPVLALVLSYLSTTSASPVTPSSSHEKRLTELPAGFYDPSSNGGAWLTTAVGASPPGSGEPINTVIAASSDYFILTNAGFMDYMASINFAAECLGQHDGNHQGANLGDGNGYVNETAVLRYDYGNYYVGTCQETIDGGNHLRYWVQNGTQANSGAIFMAVSYEQNLANGHNILNPDGYDRGRDWLVGNATMSTTKSVVTNRTFTTTSVLTPGFLPANSSANINHGLTIDGLVAVLTVKVASNASVATASTTSGASAMRGLDHDMKRVAAGLLTIFLAVALVA